MKAVNVSKSSVIAFNLEEARGFFARLRGLIGKASMEDTDGLWMARCWAIHTFGMRFPIDVVFIDGFQVVKKIVIEVCPYRPIVFCSGAEGVIELPAGTIEKAKIQVGDRIEITT